MAKVVILLAQYSDPYTNAAAVSSSPAHTGFLSSCLSGKILKEAFINLHMDRGQFDLIRRLTFFQKFWENAKNHYTEGHILD